MPTIQIWIDLWTTNSAIAINKSGKTEIIKNFERDEFTPSVYWFDKAKNPLIWKRAYEKLYKYADNEDIWNFKSEVKRLMWTPEITYFPRVEKSMKAEDISAEILKYLKSTALKQYPDLETSWVVITVPAHFSTIESEATKRAGELAWFKKVVLLQEPIAAAIAYGFSVDKNANWLIYDLWGGTFDTAIIQSMDGLLNILSSKGDNFLWWKDFDWAIVDKIFIPRILEKFNLLNFNRGNEKYRNVFNLLKWFAENAKKMLTYDNEVNIEIDKIWMDDNGNEIYMNISLTRKEFEQLISPFIKKSISLVEETIKESWINKNKIDKIVLVGWSTQTPYIKEKLEKEIGIPVDSSVDPLTVVAYGASVYAQTQVIEIDKDSKKTYNSEVYNIKLNVETTTNESEETISGIIDGLEENKEYYLQIQSESGYYSSNKILVRNWKFITDVQVEAWKANLYWIYLFDSSWSVLELSTDSFSITHGFAVGAIPIPSSIGVSIAKQNSNTLSWQSEMFWFFEKNSKLPLSKTHEFKTISTIKKWSDENKLSITAFEGESQSPRNNIFIAEIGINGNDIPFDLDANTPIEITINIDISRTLTITAYIPSMDVSVNARMTVLDEKIDASKLKEELEKERARYENIKDHLTPKQKEEIEWDIAYIESSIESGNDDVDSKLKSNKQLKDLRNEIDTLRKESELGSVTQEFNNLVKFLDDIFNEFTNPDFETQELINRYNIIKKWWIKAIEEQDKVLLPAILEQLNSLKVTIFQHSFWYWEDLFNSLLNGWFDFRDQDNAEYLIKKWNRAKENEDKDELEQVVRNLIQLLPTDARGKIEGWNLSGITI